MKKTLLSLILSCSTVVILHSQVEFEFTDTIINLENVDLVNDISHIDIYNALINQSTEEVSLRWVFIEYDCPLEWRFAKADNNYSYGFHEYTNVDSLTGIITPVVLDVEEEGAMALTLYPFETGGCCQVAFEVYNLADSTNVPIATTTYDIVLNEPDCPLISSVSESDYDLIKIFPNPTSGLLYIRLDYPIKNVQPISVHGQSFDEIYISGNNEIDIKRLPSGVYFLKIEMENGEIGWAKVSRI